MNSIVGLPNLALCGRAGAGLGVARELLYELGYEWSAGTVAGAIEPQVTELCCSRRYWSAKGCGYVIVRLEAPRQLRLERMIYSPGADVDLDDTEHLDADYVIQNDGTKAELYDELLNVILKERRKR